VSIISGAGWQARYQIDHADTSERFTRPIVVWQEDKEEEVCGLVVRLDDDKVQGSLIPAWDIEGFVGYEPIGSLSPSEMREARLPRLKYGKASHH
jgi:hypothetical protein